MPEIWFYHLELTPMQQALPELLDKVTQKGWRAYVHGLDEDHLDRLNEDLWTFRPDSFLAHGLETEVTPERQPVLLGLSGVMVNNPDVYVSVAPVEMPDVSAMKRCLVIFSGTDDNHLAWARDQWKRLKTNKMNLAYWKQNDSGRWEKMQ